MIPIPQTQRDLLAAPQGNAALYFARMTEWDEGDRATKKRADAIVRLGQSINARLQHSDATLQNIHDRQAGFLGAAAQHAEANQNGMALEIRAKLTSPFVSGLGSGHPTETGLILDRNSGLPYIPASSVKGVLRLACALHIAEKEPEAVQLGKNGPEIPDTHPLLRRYFGDTDTGKEDGARGQLVFLDAFPAEVSASLLKPDIMNPHFGKYYAGEQGPLETDNPVPVKFLAVAPGIEFVFRCFALPLPERKPDDKAAAVFRPFGQTDEETVIALFKRAFADLGFGGKTAIGYGRFEVRDEDIKRGRDVIPPPPPKPWDSWLRELAQVSDWGRLCDLAFKNEEAATWRGEEGVALAVREACSRVQAKFPKKWRENQEERDQRCREWLEPAGIAWPPEGNAPPSVPDKPDQPGDGEPEQSELEKCIRAMSQQDYLNGKVALDALGLPEARALQDRLTEWGFNARNAKDNKKAHWNKLKAHIKALGQNQA